MFLKFRNSLLYFNKKQIIDYYEYLKIQWYAKNYKYNYILNYAVNRWRTTKNISFVTSTLLPLNFRQFLPYTNSNTQRNANAGTYKTINLNLTSIIYAYLSFKM